MLGLYWGYIGAILGLYWSVGLGLMGNKGICVHIECRV